MTARPGLFLIGLAAALAACHPTEHEIALPSEPAFQQEQVQLVHEIYMAEGQTALDARQQAALSGFIGAVAPEPGETLLVMASGPAGGARGALVADAVARHGARAAVLVAHGSAAAPVTVTLRRVVTLATGCLAGDDYDALLDPGRPPTGCVNDYNLMKMVERPSDLFVGRVPGPAEAGPAAAGVERYRAGQVTPLIIEEVN